MLFKIRLNTFETNSSSVHTLVIADDDTYEKWNKGELYYDLENDNFVTFEQAKELDPTFPYPIDKEDLQKYEFFFYYDDNDKKYHDIRFVDLNTFIQCNGFSTYEETYLSKNDTIHIVEFFGYDG